MTEKDEDRAELVLAEQHPDYGGVQSTQETSSAETEWEINKAYETLGIGTAQYLYWTVSFLIAYSDYAELTLIAVIIPSLRCEWNLSGEFEAFITISIFLVYALSSLFSGKLADIYGRKTIMSITLVLLMVAAVGAATASNKYIFVLWRSLTGLCIGANFATVVVYSTEFCENKYREIGPLISILGSYWSMFMVNFLAWLFLNSMGWRWLIILITLPAIPAWILLLVMPESPRYLCASGKQERAGSAIRFMGKLNKRTIPDNITIYVHQDVVLGAFGEVFDSKHRRASVTLAVMYFCNILLETGVLVFLPLAFMTNMCGSDGEVPTRTCETLTQNDLWKLSLSALGSIVGCFAAYFVGKQVGRLLPLRVSSIIQVAALLGLYICISQLVQLGNVTVVKIINAFVCMMLWIIIPESYPTVIRTTATGMVNSAGKLGGVVGTAIVYLLFYVSPTAVITCFVVAGVVSCVGSFVLHVETKDVVLSET